MLTGCSDLEGNIADHDKASGGGPHVVRDPEHAHDPSRKGTGRSQARPSKMDRRDAREKAEAKYQKMNGPGKSDRLVVSMKIPNKADEAAEVTERSGLTKGIANQHNTRRTLSRESVPSGLERIRIAAKGDKRKRFTSLFHHISSPEGQCRTCKAGPWTKDGRGRRTWETPNVGRPPQLWTDSRKSGA